MEQGEVGSFGAGIKAHGAGIYQICQSVLRYVWVLNLKVALSIYWPGLCGLVRKTLVNTTMLYSTQNVVIQEEAAQGLT